MSDNNDLDKLKAERDKLQAEFDQIRDELRPLQDRAVKVSESLDQLDERITTLQLKDGNRHAFHLAHRVSAAHKALDEWLSGLHPSIFGHNSWIANEDAETDDEYWLIPRIQVTLEQDEDADALAAVLVQAMSELFDIFDYHDNDYYISILAHHLSEPHVPYLRTNDRGGTWELVHFRHGTETVVVAGTLQEALRAACVDDYYGRFEDDEVDPWDDY